MKQAIIIPSLNPCEQLTALVDKLLNLGAERIVLVNDGSSADYLPIFDALSTKFNLESCNLFCLYALRSSSSRRRVSVISIK